MGNEEIALKKREVYDAAAGNFPAASNTGNTVGIVLIVVGRSRLTLFLFNLHFCVTSSRQVAKNVGKFSIESTVALNFG